jgi:hypothetical protein
MSLINLKKLKQFASSFAILSSTLVIVSCTKALPELPAVSSANDLPTVALTQLTEEEIRRNKLANAQTKTDGSNAYEVVDLSSLKAE